MYDGVDSQFRKFFKQQRILLDAGPLEEFSECSGRAVRVRQVIVFETAVRHGIAEPQPKNRPKTKMEQIRFKPDHSRKGDAVKPVSRLKYLQLSMLSNPACNRVLYRAIRKNRITSIVEFGIETADRAENLIRVGQKFSGGQTIRYTGIDLFEGGRNSDRVTLKSVHQRLARLDAKTQLVPADLYSGLVKIANSHTRTDLIIISAGYDPEELERCWFYLPRMLHAASLLMIQQPSDASSPFQSLARLEVERRANQKPGTTRAA